MSATERIVEPRSATFAIAVVTAATSLLAMIWNLGVAATYWGFTPALVGVPLSFDFALPWWLTPLSATLIHGGFVHLILNLVMLLWIGMQVERVLGSANVILGYIVGAFVAAAAQWAAGPNDITPMVGASGAISALFGIYALLAAQPKPVTNSPAINRAIHAAWLLAAWVVIQWMTQAIGGAQGVTLAIPAHIGGFIAGLLLERPLLLWRYRRA